MHTTDTWTEFACAPCTHNDAHEQQCSLLNINISSLEPTANKLAIGAAVLYHHHLRTRLRHGTGDDVDTGLDVKETVAQEMLDVIVVSGRFAKMYII